MLVTTLLDMYITRLPGMSPWYRQHWSDWLSHESGRTHCQYDSIESYLAAVGVKAVGGSVVPAWKGPGTLVEPAAGQALVTAPHRSATPPFTVVDIPPSTTNLLLEGGCRYGAMDVARTWYARLVEGNKGKVVYTHLRLTAFPCNKLGQRLREYTRSIDAGLHPPGSRPCTKALYVIFIEYTGNAKVKASGWKDLRDEMKNHSVNLCLSVKEYDSGVKAWKRATQFGPTVPSPGSHQINLHPMRRPQLCGAVGRMLDMVIAVHDPEARARFLDALERGGLKPFGGLDAEQWRIIAARCLRSIRQQYRATGRYSLSWQWLDTESIRASLMSMIQREVDRARPVDPDGWQATADFWTIVRHIRDKMSPGTIVPPSASILQEIGDFWEAHNGLHTVVLTGATLAFIGVCIYIIIYGILQPTAHREKVAKLKKELAKEKATLHNVKMGLGHLGHIQSDIQDELMSEVVNDTFTVSSSQNATATLYNSDFAFPANSSTMGTGGQNATLAKNPTEADKNTAQQKVDFAQAEYDNFNNVFTAILTGGTDYLMNTATPIIDKLKGMDIPWLRSSHSKEA